MESNVQNVTVYQGDDDQWYWRAQAGNGEIVAQGEAFTRKDDAVRAARGVFPDHWTGTTDTDPQEE